MNNQTIYLNEQTNFYNLIVLHCSIDFKCLAVSNCFKWLTKKSLNFFQSRRLEREAEPTVELGRK